MGNPSATTRQPAITLKAADAKILLGSLPFVRTVLTAPQVQQVQQVLDAAVVNPAARRKQNELMRQSIVAQSGNLVSRNPDVVRRAEQVARTIIPVTEASRRIRINHLPLLALDAFKPLTDNPDEARYWAKVKGTLATRGVWLRIGQPFVRDGQDPSRHLIDPRKFEVWLSLGESGDFIPTKDGKLTRAVLLGITSISAGYYREVTQGHLQKVIDNAIRNLKSQLSTGETLHEMQRKARAGAAPGVVRISDALGSASFPSQKMWNEAHELLVAALSDNVSGNIKVAGEKIHFAATLVTIAAKRLDDYIAATLKGANRAVGILTVAKVAGEIAEAFLLIRFLVMRLASFMAGEAVSSGAAALPRASTTTQLPKNHSPAAYARTSVGGPQAHNPTNVANPAALDQTNFVHRQAFARTLNQANMTGGSTSMPPLSRYDIAVQEKVAAWNKDFIAEVRRMSEANGFQPISMAGYQRAWDAATARWGDVRRLLD